MSTKIATSIVFWLALGGALAADAKAEMIQRVLEVTGITKQLAQVPAAITSMYDQQKGEFDNETLAKIQEVIADSFAETSFHQFQVDQLANDYRADLVADILKTYADPLFLRITDAETEFSAGDHSSAVAAFDYGTIDAERDRWMEQFLKDTRLVELQEEVLLGSTKAFIATWNLFLTKERRISKDIEASILENVVSALRSPEYRLYQKKLVAVMYRDFSNEEIRRYLVFYTNPEGRYLMSSFTRAFQKGLQNCMQTAAGALITAFGLDPEKA